MKPNMTTMLDEISRSIEKTVRAHHGVRDTKKRMTLRAFVPYALTQLQKAGAEQQDLATRRLDALKRSVDQVAARVAKLNPEDLDSEKITVEVETAYAPTGGPQIDGLTTAPDQSSTERALTSVGAASGDTNFAQNLTEAVKALQKIKEGLEPAPKNAAAANQPAGSDKPRRSAAAKATDGGDAASEPGWPLDLNTGAFRDGVTKAEDEPIWGFDPDGVRSAKAE
jgi:hypothetical protein